MYYGNSPDMADLTMGRGQLRAPQRGIRAVFWPWPPWPPWPPLKNILKNINSTKCPLLNPPSQHQDFFSEVTPEGWPWWPWWPSTIGRDSRRPTANPMLMSGYLCASASVGADSACLAGYHMGRDHTARQDPFCLGSRHKGKRRRRRLCGSCRVPVRLPISAPGCLATRG